MGEEAERNVASNSAALPPARDLCLVEESAAGSSGAPAQLPSELTASGEQKLSEEEKLAFRERGLVHFRPWYISTGNHVEPMNSLRSSQHVFIESLDTGCRLVSDAAEKESSIRWIMNHEEVELSLL